MTLGGHVVTVPIKANAKRIVVRCRLNTSVVILEKAELKTGPKFSTRSPWQKS
jgi:hypothetical protein